MRIPRTARRLLASAASLAVTIAAFGQVPQLLNYQGRVSVFGANFQGSGQFRFALVDAAGTTTYWSNDGTSVGGAAPSAAVSLPVSNGLYTVLLGDASLPNMSAIPNAVFDHSDVRLRVWFDDGTNGQQQLFPDQRIAAVGYAIIAANVPDGAITAAKLAPGAVTAGSIAPGAISSTQLAPGAAAANLAASGQSGVASGGTVLGTSANSAELQAAGYVNLGPVTLPDQWLNRSTTGVPSARYRHTAVWTGSEMIVWGGILSGTGLNPTYLNDGGRYSPATDSWTSLSTTNAPAVRGMHSAVWSGSEMIVWGGISTGGTLLGTGGRYNPTSNTWTSVNTVGAPSARRFHGVVWTGSEMLVWGGAGSSSILGDGARYNPGTNTWAALPGTGAPAARVYHTTVWTGTEMIVWGGSTTGAVADGVASGARYHRGNNAWTPTQAFFTPTPRLLHSAVWTGTEMIVWGGVTNTGQNTADGARYNAASNGWAALPNTLAPSKRDSCIAFWTGSAMVIWGGLGGGGVPPTDGAQYQLSTNTWLPMTAATPTSRGYHSLVWTGAQALVFGGTAEPTSNTPTAFFDIWSYQPSRTMYLYSRP